MEPSGSQAHPESEVMVPLETPAVVPNACAQPPARAGQALAINLLCGLRLACFRRVPLERFCVSAEQLICLAVIDLLLAFAADFAAYGWPGRFNAWGLPGALFYLPLMLLAGVLVARRAGVPQLKLALPIAWLAAAQYVSLVTLVLSAASDGFDLTQRAVFLAYYWGPLAWWMAISAFVTYTLVPARIVVRADALVLVALLVVTPSWLMPRTSGSTRWTALQDEPHQSKRFDSLASEEAFYAQPELLRRALDKIAPGVRGRSHLYFVGVAGYAEEDV